MAIRLWITNEPWRILMARQPWVTGASELNGSLPSCVWWPQAGESEPGEGHTQGCISPASCPWRNDFPNIISVFGLSVCSGHAFILSWNMKERWERAFYNLSHCPLDPPELSLATRRSQSSDEFQTVSDTRDNTVSHSHPLALPGAASGTFLMKVFSTQMGLQPRHYTEGALSSRVMSSHTWTDIQQYFHPIPKVLKNTFPKCPKFGASQMVHW